ncbi:recombinase family protein [Ferruginibacter lapsinanis]|uniref:recombinase family protein n=1 Tax=Ferruginibacter lapsinanis TaxID=563172 RepID=UPI001E4D1EE8|nr:recombinase family protein [Ferruginibacter lapsinanis]UEG50312.1 recombinase family protein [Ferruginibacter lapsinanis]
MKKAKYIRCSTVEQNTSRQEVNSSEFSKIYIDRCSGTIGLKERKEGRRLIKDIEAGQIDELHVVSICRLGRSIIELLNNVEFFTAHRVNLYVENIGMYSMINGKPNPTFKMIVSVLGNVAEMERLGILEKQRMGIELAKAQGKYKGRLYGTKMSDNELLEKYKKTVKELKAGQSLRRAAALGECSLSTAHRISKLIAA